MIRPRWEYRQITWTGDFNQSEFDRLGRGGWELVNYTKHTGFFSNSWSAVFKRKITNTAK